jgi:hypothetical protein
MMRLQKLIEKYASLPHFFAPCGCYPWPLLDYATTRQRNATGRSPQRVPMHEAKGDVAAKTSPLSEARASV